MNLLELLNPKPQKNKGVKYILTEEQTKRLIDNIKKENYIKKNAKESKTSKG
jgi:hypothetical protein